MRLNTARKTRHLSRKLAFSLSTVLLLVGGAMLLVFFFLSRYQESSEVKSRSKEYLDAISDSLERPLMERDESTIEAVCSAYAQSELVGALEVTGSDGYTYFSWRKGDGDLPEMETAPLSHNGEQLGSVSVGFQTNYVHMIDLRVCWLYAATLCLIALLLFLIMNRLLVRLLRTPLRELSSLIESSALENEGASFGERAQYIEFEPLSDLVGDLVRSIQERTKLLRESEEKYRVLFESFPLGVSITDESGKILETNRRSESLLGISKSEHQGRNIRGSEWPIVRPDRTTMPADQHPAVEALNRGCRIENAEMGVLRPDGEVVWLNVTAAPIPLENHGVAVAYSDIRKQKESEEELVKSENRTRAMLSEFLTGVVVHNGDTSVRFVNRRATEILGLSAEEMQGKIAADPSWNFIHEDLTVMTVEEYPVNKVLSTREPFYDLVLGIRRPDRQKITWVIVNAVPIMATDGTVDSVAVNFVDVTEQKLLKEHRDRVAENMPGVIYRCVQPEGSSKHVFTYISAGVREMFELEPDAIMADGDLLWAAIHSDDVGAFWDSVKAATKTMKPWSHEWRIRTTSGATKWIKGVARPQRTAEESLAWDGLFLDISERKVTEMKLEESESRFRSLFANIPDPVFIHDADDGRVVLANEPACAVYGYTLEEIVALYPRDFDTPDQAEDVPARIKKLNSTGHLVFESRHRTREGRTFAVEVHSRITVFGDRKVMITVCRDIDQRRRSEEELRAMGHKLKLAMDAAEEGLWEWNLKTDQIHCDETALRMTGYDHDGLQGGPGKGSWWMEQIHPDDTDEIEARMKQYLEGETSGYTGVFRFRHRNGDYIWVRSDGRIFSRDMDGNPEVVIGINRDVTEHWKGREELRASEEKFRAILENIGMGVALISQDMQVLETNRWIREWFPRTAFGQGNLCYHLFNEPSTPGPCDKCPVLKTFRDGGVHDTLSGETKAGEGRTFRIVSSPIRDRDGNVSAAIEIVEDVTERLSLEKQLHHVQKMESIGTLAGGIAHDFNNILGIILGYTELALFKAAEGSLQHTHLQRVMDAVIRGKDLASQILAFSRQDEQERKPIDLVSIVKDALKLLRATIPSTVEIRSNLRVETATILGDPTQIHQILLNLCTNAGHAMQDNGGLLEIALDEERIASSSLEEFNELHAGIHYRLTVRDTGVGMDKEILDRIFDPYFTTKKPDEGTGLGLAVVHGIISGHGGAVRVHSEPGKGTTFRLFFPGFEAEAMSELPEMKPTGPEHPARILFVDDEEALVDYGRQMLEHLGHDVVALANSAEALEIFRSDPARFDLVITDMTMPGLTGVVLASGMLEIRPDIPIILCTGFRESIGQDKARAVGIRQLLTKPILVQDLHEAIQKLLWDKAQE